MNRLCVFILLLAYSWAAAATYYVEPVTGSDDSPDGSSAMPWKTIAYALSQVADGDTLELAAGEYSHDDEGDLTLSAKGITINGPTSGTARVFATLKFDGNGTQKAIAFANWTLDGTGAGNTTATGTTKSLCVIEDSLFSANGFRIENSDYNGLTVRADGVATKATVLNCYVQCGRAVGADANKDCVSIEAASATLAAQSSLFVRGLQYGGHGDGANNQVVTGHSGAAVVVWDPHWSISTGTAVAGDNNSPVYVIGGHIQFSGTALSTGLGVVAQVVVGLRTNGTIQFDRSGSAISQCIVDTTNANAIKPSVVGLAGVTIEHCVLNSGGSGDTVSLGNTTSPIVRRNEIIYSGANSLGQGCCQSDGSGLVFEYNRCVTSSSVVYSSTGAVTIRGNHGTHNGTGSRQAVYAPAFSALVIDANIFDGFTGSNVIEVKSASGDTTCKVTGNLIRAGNRGLQLQGASAGGGTCTYTIASNAMASIDTHSVQIVANSQTMTASNCGSNALSKTASGYTATTGDSTTVTAAFDGKSMPNPQGDLLQGIDGTGAVPIAMLLYQVRFSGTLSYPGTVGAHGIHGP
jgi:hypothetical protein